MIDILYNYIKEDLISIMAGDEIGYKGECKDGLRHGKGTFTYSKMAGGNAEYIGEWKDNRRDGWGTYRNYQEKSGYEGEWKDGLRHGQGTFVNRYGDGYEGEYKDGLRNGQGTAFYGGGSKRVAGVWKEGVFLYEVENSSLWDSLR